MADIPVQITAIIELLLFALMIELSMRYALARARGRAMGWSGGAEAYTLVLLILVGMQVLASIMGLFGAIEITEPVPEAPDESQPVYTPVEQFLLFTRALITAVFTLWVLLAARSRKEGLIVGIALFLVPFQTFTETGFFLLMGGPLSAVMPVIIVGFCLFWWANHAFGRLVR